MKTLHVTNAWHGQSGGIKAFYTAMLRAANALARPMCVVVPGERDSVESIGTWGRLHTIEAPRVPFVDRRYRVILPHHFLRASGRLRQILADERPDLVEVCDKYALPYFAGWIRRHLPAGLPRPTLVCLSCERADHSLQALGAHGRALARAARLYMGAVYLPQCDYHLANSSYTADELVAAQRGAHPREVFQVPMGVDVGALGPHHRSEPWRALWRQRLQLPGSGLLMVYVGRIAQEKRLHIAIETLAHVRRAGRAAGLVLVGSGPEVPHLTGLAARLVPGSVGFAGHVSSRDALAVIYASGDVFLHVNDREPFGIGPLEAMASGVPVVLPRAGGVLTYANDQNAWLADPGPAALAAAVLAAAGGDLARRAAAVETAAAYDWKRVAPLIFRMYDELHERALLVDRGRWRRPSTLTPRTDPAS